MKYEVVYWRNDEVRRYTLDEHNIESVVAYEGCVGDAEIEIYQFGGTVQRLKRWGSKWLLHCLTAPAFDTDTYFEYWIDGFAVELINMPFSEEEKCMLTLKYGDQLIGSTPNVYSKQ